VWATSMEWEENIWGGLDGNGKGRGFTGEKAGTAIPLHVFKKRGLEVT